MVCVHEQQCKGHCILGAKGEPISFYKIEEEVSMKFLNERTLLMGERTLERIAIIGGGPAGITIA